MAQDHTPGVYAKGDDFRVANRATDAVNLAARGFRKVSDEEVPGRKALQGAAKAAGVPANQSSDALADALHDLHPGVDLT